MKTLILALLSIVMSVTAQVMLRRGMSLVIESADSRAAIWWGAASSPWVAGGLALYGGSALLWLGVLARWEVSKAYPLVGLGFVLTLLAGWVIGEQVGVVRASGVLLIAAGVVLVASS